MSAEELRVGLVIDSLYASLRSGQARKFCGHHFQGRGDRCTDCHVPRSPHRILEAITLLEMLRRQP